MTSNNDSSADKALTIQDDWTMISQGAEARLYKVVDYFPNQEAIVKHRFSKAYRHPILDERLTKQRTKSEAKCLLKCRRAGVPCPAVYCMQPNMGFIVMEYLPGISVKQYLDTTTSHEDFGDLPRDLGMLIARMHNLGVIHGDLTTSNFLHPLQVIDFGLSRISQNPEEMAVDLYVLERALQSTHPLLPDTFLETLLASYKASGKKSHAVLLRLSQVRQRGRKRECFG